MDLVSQCRILFYAFLYIKVSCLNVLLLYALYRFYHLLAYAWHRADIPQPGKLPIDELYYPFVTVQLPIFNESTVIERLIDACCEIHWPKTRFEVQVLDDSNDETTSIAQSRAATWRLKGVNCNIIRRASRIGYKAGALEYGLLEARGDFIAIFDADFIPTPNFLERAIPYFYDNNRLDRSKIAMVQAVWGFLNAKDSLLTGAQSVWLDGHFMLEQTIRNRTINFFNFNGTAGIWRRSAIEEAGGWQHDTVTEDCDLSYRCWMKDYKFTFVQGLVQPSEIPADMVAYKAQQNRWTKGYSQVTRKLFITIMCCCKLPLRFRIEAFYHLTSPVCYLMGLLILFLDPLRWSISVFILDDDNLVPFITEFAIDMVCVVVAVVVGIFYLVAGLVASSVHSSQARQSILFHRISHIPVLLVLFIGISFHQSIAFLEGYISNNIKFVRTPKLGTNLKKSKRLIRYRAKVASSTWGELFLAIYFLSACCAQVTLLILSGREASWDWFGILINFFVACGFIWTGGSGLITCFRDCGHPRPAPIVEYGSPILGRGDEYASLTKYPL